MSASVWRKVLIGNIFEMKVGGDLDLKSFSPYKESIYQFPIYSNGLEKNGLYGYTSIPKFKKDSVTITGRGTLGHAEYRSIGFDAIIRIIVLEKKYEDINGFLISEIINFFKPFIFESTSIPQLTAPSVAKTRIYFPKDLEEQKHIAEILSTCDAVIQNTQKTIDKYKAIKQGMMQDLFTRGLTRDGKLRPSYKEAPELYKESVLGMIPKEWEVDCIGNNYTTYAGGTPNREHEEYYKGTIPWVSSSECNQFEINDTNEHITEFAVQNSSTKMVKAGAILLALYGATAGQVAKLNIDATTNQAVLACLSDMKNDNNYLFYYINYIKEKMLYFAQGSGQPNLSKDSVDKFIYLKSKKEEQIEIAKRLSSIDSTIQKEEAILEKYKNIKTGLMARLLTPPKDAEIIDETEE